MADPQPTYVFETGSLCEVYTRRKSNVLVDGFTTVCVENRISYSGLAIREVGEIDKDAKKFLSGIEGFGNQKVNPPQNILARACSIQKMSDGRRLSDVDKWSLAIAKETGSALVLERFGKKAELLRTVAAKLDVEVLNLNEFLENEL